VAGFHITGLRLAGESTSCKPAHLRNPLLCRALHGDARSGYLSGPRRSAWLLRWDRSWHG
jgi:hypothetical protein